MSLWNQRVGRFYVHLYESWSDGPPDSPWAKWFGGITAPAFCAWIGVKACVAKHAVFVSRGTELPLSGAAAVGFGVALLGAALFLHFHYFWGNAGKFCVVSNPGKVVGLLTFIAGLGLMTWMIINS